jgi:hypothetical protein
MRAPFGIDLLFEADDVPLVIGWPRKSAPVRSIRQKSHGEVKSASS